MTTPKTRRAALLLILGFLASLAAAAKASPSPKVELNVEPSTSTAAQNTATNTNINEPIQEVSNSTPQSIESSPWAHMQLHEFAPKIVVVGVGGAGTNAVNNMVASGLSGELCELQCYFYIAQCYSVNCIHLP